jgi:uncharacterized phiE125 gp8 family phage protein
MFPIQVEGPAVEPVLLSEMKAYLRVDDDAENDLISGLVKAARLMVEAAARRALVAQTWRLMLHEWPSSRSLALPLSPLIAIDKVEVFDAAGVATPLAREAIEVDSDDDPPRIFFLHTPAPGRSRHGIAIEFRAGYGALAEDVPAPLRLAIKVIVARWFENRGDVAGEPSLPVEALTLIAPFQRPRL